MSNFVEFKNRLRDFVVLSEKEKVKLCKAIGINSRTLTLAMDYGILPSPKTLTIIADYYNTSIDYLIGNTDNDNFVPSKNRDTFANRLRTIMQQKSITAYRFAKSCHIDNSYVTKWLKGQFVASWQFLEIISDKYDVTIDYLLGRSDF